MCLNPRSLSIIRSSKARISVLSPPDNDSISAPCVVVNLRRSHFTRSEDIRHKAKTSIPRKKDRLMRRSTSRSVLGIRSDILNPSWSPAGGAATGGGGSGGGEGLPKRFARKSIACIISPQIHLKGMSISCIKAASTIDPTKRPRAMITTTLMIVIISQCLRNCGSLFGLLDAWDRDIPSKEKRKKAMIQGVELAR